MISKGGGFQGGCNRAWALSPADWVGHPRPLGAGHEHPSVRPGWTRPDRAGSDSPIKKAPRGDLYRRTELLNLRDGRVAAQQARVTTNQCSLLGKVSASFYYKDFSILLIKINLLQYTRKIEKNIGSVQNTLPNKIAGFDITKESPLKQNPRFGECYTCLGCETITRVVHISVIFQDSPMFSHINGKLSPRPFESYNWT